MKSFDRTSRVLRAHIQLCPTAPPMRLPIPNPNPNPISSPNPNLFFERKQKRHRNIGQHRVIFTGYLLSDGGGVIRGP